ncbi:MAG: Ig-like domain-containing protein, partial [Marinoscillum sp.]
STVSVPGSTIVAGSSNNLLYEIRMDVSGGDVDFFGFYLMPSGIYDETDFDQFTFYESIDDDDFVSATPLGSVGFSLDDPEGIPDGGVGLIFNGSYTDGSTIYFYVTADVSSSAVVGNTLSFNAPDYETNFAFDYASTIDGGLVTGETYTISPADLDPPIITGEASHDIPENTTIVGSYTANEPVTWSLTGDDASLFNISTIGDLSFLSSPDFESPSDLNADNYYDVTIESTDTAFNVSTLPLEITITDENDNAPVIADPGTVSIDEGSPVTTELIDLEYTDADTTSTTFTWNIASGNDDVDGDSDLAFVIDPSNGAISVNDSEDLDFEIQNSFTLEIELSDGVNTDIFNLNITLNDLVEDITAPVVTLADLVTNDQSPALDGNIDDDAAYVIVNVEGTDYPAVNNEDGSWSLPQGELADLTEGTYTVTVTGIDDVGNEGTTTATLTIDLTAPVVSLSDISTNDQSPALYGNIDDDAAFVFVTVEGTDYPAINNEDGSWSLPQGELADLTEGTYTVTVTGIDDVGN